MCRNQFIIPGFLYSALFSTHFFCKVFYEIFCGVLCEQLYLCVCVFVIDKLDRWVVWISWV